MILRLVHASPDGPEIGLPAGWLPGCDEVWVWCTVLRLDRPPAERWRGRLTPAEIERLERFRRGEDRERFLVGRGLLRSVLGMCVGLPAADVPLRFGAFGKPILGGEVARRTRIRFNLAHSGRVVLLALTSAGEIGVDVEAAVLPDDWLAVAKRIFSPRERAELAALPAAQHPAAFFNCWTRKEACLKATGKGLAADPLALEVTLVPGQSARLLSIGGRPADPNQWQLRELPLPEGYAGAVAVRVKRPRAPLMGH